MLKWCSAASVAATVLALCSTTELLAQMDVADGLHVHTKSEAVSQGMRRGLIR